MGLGAALKVAQKAAPGVKKALAPILRKAGQQVMKQGQKEMLQVVNKYEKNPSKLLQNFGKVRRAGQQMMMPQQQQMMMPRQQQMVPQLQITGAAAPTRAPGNMVRYMSKGGVVRKGGRYYLHKGEKVVAKRSVPKVTKAMQKDGMRVRHKGAAAVKKVPFVPLSKLRNIGNGGAVLKTGLHVLKAGQRVIPASKVAKAKKAIKKA